MKTRMTPERWARIEDLYHRSMEMGTDGREAFLRETCADDPELRREVEQLLAGAGSATRFLEEPIFVQRVNSEVAGASAEPSWIGRQVGSYEILSVLGVGGMGEVYRARFQTEKT